MKYTEINKKFTDIVADHFARGYAINTATMSGSQGERSRVDLTNGTEIVTVYLNKFHTWEDNYDLAGWELVVARPGNQKEELIPNDHLGYSTLWLSRAEVISVERFYQMGRDDDWFVAKEEAKIAAAKQHERYTRKPCKYDSKTVKIENSKAIELAKQYLIDRRVGKRIDTRFLEVKKCIEKSGTRFYIVYKSNYYGLH